MTPATARREAGYSVIYTLVVTLVLSVCVVLYLYPAPPAPNLLVSHTSTRQYCDPNSPPLTKRVAIIGAGAAGASTAYHLRQYASHCQAQNVTVYEKSDYVGGRSTTVNVYDDPSQPVELGASIFIEANSILTTSARKFGLETGDREHRPETLGVWDGETFRFTQNNMGNEWWNNIKLIWKYGLAPIRTQRLMKEVVGKFFKIYEEPYFPFRSLSETAFELGLAEITATTGNVFLAANSIGPPFTTDIIQASTRVNYAQDLGEIHGLETMVCMSTDGAMAVKGGNWQIFDGMLKNVGAHILLNTSVAEIKKQDDGSYLVHSIHAGPGTSEDPATEEYDSVVIAAPFQFSGIKVSPALPHIPDKIPYVRLHVTLFASPHKASRLFFNLAEPAKVPEVILTTLPSGAELSGDDRAPSGFFSFSTLRSVRNTAYKPPRYEYLYKIFSPKPLNATFLASLMGFPAPSSGNQSLQKINKEEISWVYEKVWDSYPYELPRVTFEDLQLDDNLWYTSGIESFISTMETSALMGMNVAKLITDSWITGSPKTKKLQENYSRKSDYIEL